jgi:hypothetical protein
MAAEQCQIVTGITLAYKLRPEFFGWWGFSDHLSTHLTLKFSCLLLTFLLAVDARLRIVPKLTAENMLSLAFHIIPVTLLSIVFVLLGLNIRLANLF